MMQISKVDNCSTTLRHQDWDRNCESHQKLKQELRMTIMAKRHARGEEDIKVDFSEPETRELSEAELERKERRKEQNRKAAQRCRRKKRLSQMSVIQNYEAIVSHNQQLTEHVEQLRQETQHLQTVLQTYRDNCTCPARGESTLTASSYPPPFQASLSNSSSSSSSSGVACLAPQVKPEPRDGSPCDYGGSLLRDCGPPLGENAQVGQRLSYLGPAASQSAPMDARSIPFTNPSFLDDYEVRPHPRSLTSSAGQSAQGGQRLAYYDPPEGQSTPGGQRLGYQNSGGGESAQGGQRLDYYDPHGGQSAQGGQRLGFQGPAGGQSAQEGQCLGYGGSAECLSFLDDCEARQHPKPPTSSCHYPPADRTTSPSSSPCSCSNHNNSVDINGSRLRPGLCVPRASQQQTVPMEWTCTTHGSTPCSSRLWCDHLSRARLEEILREWAPPPPPKRYPTVFNWPFFDPPRKQLASSCHFQNEVSGPHSADGRRSISSVSSDVSGGSERPRHDAIATPPSLPPMQPMQPPVDMLIEGLGGDAEDEMANLTSSDVSQILAEINDCDDILDDDVFLCPDDPPDRSHPFQPML